MALTHKERMQIMMEHREPDRVPVNAFFVSEVSDRLRKLYSMELTEFKNTEPRALKYPEYELDMFLGHEMLFVQYGISEFFSHESEEEVFSDEWGIKYKKVYYDTPNGTGKYNEIIEYPLSDDKALKDYKPPDPSSADLDKARRVLDDFGKDYYLVGCVACSIFEGLKYLRGIDKCMIDLVKNQDIASDIMDISIDYHLEVGKELIKMGFDMIDLADDLGGEKALLISPETFRSLIKPKMDYMIGEFKKLNKDIKINFHTCGYIEPLIEDLIEVGVDLLHPIQPETMDPAFIKKKFGNRICLNGTVSTQRTLPFGTGADVRDEVRKRILSCAPGGGFLIGPAQAVQLDVPLENIQAFYGAISEFGEYPVRS